MEQSVLKAGLDESKQRMLPGYLNVSRAWTELNGVLNQAWSADVQEASEAIAAAKKTGSCPQGKDFERQQKEFQDAYEGVKKEVAALVNGPFRQHDGVIDEMIDKGYSWVSIADQVDEVNKAVGDHLEADEWKSDGAKTYKQAIPTQRDALTELKSVAVSQGHGAMLFAQLNSIVYAQASEGMKKIADKIRAMPGPQPISATRGLVNSGSIGGESLFDFKFFSRSFQGKASLEWFRDWANKQLSPDQADWAGSAGTMGEAIRKAESAPLNLEASGLWPEGKAGASAGVAVIDLQANYTVGISDFTTDAKSEEGGIDLDRKVLGG